MSFYLILEDDDNGDSFQLSYPFTLNCFLFFSSQGWVGSEDLFISTNVDEV